MRLAGGSSEMAQIGGSQNITRMMLGPDVVGAAALPYFDMHAYGVDLVGQSLGVIVNGVGAPAGVSVRSNSANQPGFSIYESLNNSRAYFMLAGGGSEILLIGGPGTGMQLISIGTDNLGAGVNVGIVVRTNKVDIERGILDILAGGNVVPAAAPATNAIGYLGSPQIQDFDDYTLVMADAGKHYYHTSATPHALTIPANGSVAYPIGTVISIVNENGAGAITLAITTDTLRWGSLTGPRTIAANGTATLLKVAATVWRLTGEGIS
jgi:hypothetical protein